MYILAYISKFITYAQEAWQKDEYEEQVHLLAWDNETCTYYSGFLGFLVSTDTKDYAI
jgi:hypothetical protein